MHCSLPLHAPAHGMMDDVHAPALPPAALALTPSHTDRAPASSFTN